MSLSAGQAERLAAAARAADPKTLFAAIAAVAAEAIGCALFTAMRCDQAAGEVERVYSTNPAAYPVGGRKTKRDTPWARQVLSERRVFVGGGAGAIRAAFDDHAVILGLGLNSIINVPVVIDGRCVGTLNFLMAAETVAEADVAVARALGALAIPAFAAGVPARP